MKAKTKSSAPKLLCDPLWQSNWEGAEKAWDEAASAAAGSHPLRVLKTLPKMEGITPDTAKGLKWKSLKWMVLRDAHGDIRRGFLKHPFKYAWRFLSSLLQKKSYIRDGDFFLYGVSSVADFEKELASENSLLVLGFSYCHKPFECPSGRFSDRCVNDSSHPVCRQCFIGKAASAIAKERTHLLFIPTVHYVGGKILEIVHAHEDKKVLFIITACEMTLEMFGDFGNMAGICGIGVRLDGRICNTMKAFELSETGIKPGLTVVLSETQKRILSLIRCRNDSLSHLRAAGP